MRYLLFFITIYIHYLILTVVKLLDNPYLFLAISIAIAGVGALLYFLDKKKQITSEIGWGILSGAITSLVLVFGFLMFLVIALSG